MSMAEERHRFRPPEVSSSRCRRPRGSSGRPPGCGTTSFRRRQIPSPRSSRRLRVLGGLVVARLADLRRHLRRRRTARPASRRPTGRRRAPAGPSSRRSSASSSTAATRSTSVGGSTSCSSCSPRCSCRWPSRRRPTSARTPSRSWWLFPLVALVLLTGGNFDFSPSTNLILIGMLAAVIVFSLLTSGHRGDRQSVLPARRDRASPPASLSESSRRFFRCCPSREVRGRSPMSGGLRSAFGGRPLPLGPFVLGVTGIIAIVLSVIALIANRMDPNARKVSRRRGHRTRRRADPHLFRPRFRLRAAAGRDVALGRPAGHAGRRGDRHRRLAAARHPAGARPPLEAADHQMGVGRLRRALARRAADHRALHGERHAAALPAGRRQLRQADAGADRRGALLGRLHGGGHPRRAAGDPARTVRGGLGASASATGSRCASSCCRRR